MRRECRIASAALYARVRILCTTLHTRPRVQRASGIPCSLLFEGNDMQTSGASRRENADVYLLFDIRNRIFAASLRAQRSNPFSLSKCFVALLLAMTTERSAPGLRWLLRPQGRNDRIQPVGQRGGARLQDQRRFYLNDAVVADRGNLAPSGAASNAVRNDLLAAPRREDHVRCGGADDIGQDDPVLGGLLKPQVRQDVFAAGDLDQFGNPADAADQRFVPFLEIDFWFWRRPRRGRDACQTLLIAGCELIGALRRIDQSPKGADHRQDAGDVALVEAVDRDAGTDQVGDDVRLQIRESQHQIRLQREDFRNVRRDERRNPRLLAPHLRRATPLARDPDDPVLLAEQIQRLDGFLGEADDPAGREVAHGGRYGELWSACHRRNYPGRHCRA